MAIGGAAGRVRRSEERRDRRGIPNPATHGRDSWSRFDPNLITDRAMIGNAGAHPR